MRIDSSIVGTEFLGLKREVTWRDTMNYAAAVGDTNPSYMDDTRDGGIIAPPLFAAAITWPFVENVQTQLRGAIPQEFLGTVVQASEHLIFHRPIRHGSQLTINGRVAAVMPAPRGTLMVLRVDAWDEEGREVFTEFNGAFLRGVICADIGKGDEALPKPASWRETSEPMWEVSIPISKHAAHVYDGCSGIVSPIHTSRAFARGVGLPDTILQGTAILAFAAREIINREGGGDPCRLREIGCRFAGMVLPGTELHVRLLGVRESANATRRHFFRVLNAEGQPATRDGFARLD